MADESGRQILAATFNSRQGGARAAGALGGGFPDRVGNTAVLHVNDEGEAKFVESKDWGAGRGALLGGAIGILGGPLGMLAGGGIGALASKLRDSGFKNDQLERLGESLSPGSTAVIVEIAASGLDQATRVLNALDAVQVVTEQLDSDVDELFGVEAEPTPEPDEAAAVTWSKL